MKLARNVCLALGLLAFVTALYGAAISMRTPSAYLNPPGIVTIRKGASFQVGDFLEALKGTKVTGFLVSAMVLLGAASFIQSTRLRSRPMER